MKKIIICLFAYGAICSASFAPSSAPLFYEGFENASGVLENTGLADIYHAGGTPKNITISPVSPHSGAYCLRWLRKDSGFYYARGKRWLKSGTGKLAVSFWVDFATTHPYWWSFALSDSTYSHPYAQIFEGLGYPGNANVEWGMLRSWNPDGTFRSLCPVKTGWHQIKMNLDLQSKRMDFYYDDMDTPVVANLLLSNTDVTPSSSFLPSFSGYSSAGEGAFSLDDITVADRPRDTMLRTSQRPTKTRNSSSDESLHTRNCQVVISRSTGAITSVSSSGRKLIADTNDTYRFQAEHASAYATESEDTVQSSRRDGESIEMTCANTHLPGLRIHKKYRFADNGDLLKEVSFESTRASGFISHTLDVRLDSRFLAASWPAGFPIDAALAPGYRTMIKNTPCSISKDFSAGIATYRYQVNGQFVLPGTTNETPDGWESLEFSDYVKPGKSVGGVSAFFVFKGDFTDYERHLTHLKEYQRLFPPSTSPWLDRLVCDRMFLSGDVAFEQKAQPLTVTSTIWFLDPPWGNWWSFSDPPKSTPGHPPVASIAPSIRAGASNARASAYANNTFDSNSDVYKSHRDYGVIDRDGALTDTGIPSDAGGAPTYYIQILDPEARNYYLNMYAERVRNWKLDFLYLDGPGGFHEMPDWKRHRVVQSYDWLAYYRDLKARLLQVSPDVAFFTNGVVPYSDIGYIEWRDEQWKELMGDTDWRYFARELLRMKIRESRGYVIVPTPGDPGAQPAITTYSIAYGWCGHLSAPALLPWKVAALEYRGLAVAPDTIEPRWWRTGADVEAYALTKGDNVVVNVIGHSKQTNTRITLDTRHLALLQGRTYLLRILTMNAPSDGTAARAFTQQSMRLVRIEGASLPLDIPIQKNLLTSVVISRALAIEARNALEPSQTGIVETYAGRLKVTANQGDAYHYTLSSQYAGTEAFFPYAIRLKTGSNKISQAPADVERIHGIRMTVKQPGTYTLDVGYRF